MLEPNDALEAKITAYIRAGGFAHVAAGAAGVTRELFEEWMHRGEHAKEGDPCLHFRLAVLQAQAQVRLGAEVKALQEKPMDWLKSGPGRDTSEAPGWTAPARAQHGRDDGAADLFRHPELQTLFATLLDVLAPFPEARAAVAQTISASGSPPAAANRTSNSPSTS
jgi:hypothetical protein